MNDVALVHYTVTEDYFQPQKAVFTRTAERMPILILKLNQSLLY